MNRITEKIIAHRGESFDAPENTLASINLAWARGIKLVETDIHLTKDNEVVVIHDKDTLRISGVKKIIRKSSLKELKLLDAGSHKNEKWKSESIPTLKEVLRTVPADGKLIIEIKSDGRILRKLKDELSQSNLEDSQIQIIAFSEEILKKARYIMPDYKMLWLLDLDYYRPSWSIRMNITGKIRTIRKLKLNGIDVWSGKLLTSKLIKAFRDEGLLVYAWTVNEPVRALELIDAGIDGITTDRAGWMKEQLDS